MKLLPLSVVILTYVFLSWVVYGVHVPSLSGVLEFGMSVNDSIRLSLFLLPVFTAMVLFGVGVYVRKKNRMVTKLDFATVFILSIIWLTIELVTNTMYIGPPCFEGIHAFRTLLADNSNGLTFIFSILSFIGFFWSKSVKAVKVIHVTMLVIILIFITLVLIGYNTYVVNDGKYGPGCFSPIIPISLK